MTTFNASDDVIGVISVESGDVMALVANTSAFLFLGIPTREGTYKNFRRFLDDRIKCSNESLWIFCRM